MLGVAREHSLLPMQFVTFLLSDARRSVCSVGVHRKRVRVARENVWVCVCVSLERRHCDWPIVSVR